MIFSEYVNFIKEHGAEVFADIYKGDDFKLVWELDWLLANHRIFVVRNKGRMVAIAAWVVLDTTKDVLAGKWPVDNPEGQYIFVRFLIVHSKVNNYGIMKYMAGKVKEWFPKVRFLIYGRDNKERLIKLNRFLGIVTKKKEGEKAHV